MELEFFIRPDEAVEAICGAVARPAGPGHPGEPQPDWGWQMWHQYWVEERLRFYENIGLPRASLVEYWQKPEELAHYARATVDILYKFPFSKRDAKGELAGEELEGVAARSDFDLSQHQRFSGKSMTVFDEELKAAWPKLDDAKKAALTARCFRGRGRNILSRRANRREGRRPGPPGRRRTSPTAITSPTSSSLPPAWTASPWPSSATPTARTRRPTKRANWRTRVVMRFHPRIAPLKVAVFPLLKNRPELVAKGACRSGICSGPT